MLDIKLIQQIIKSLTSIFKFAIVKLTKTTHPVSRKGARWVFFVEIYA